MNAIVAIIQASLRYSFATNQLTVARIRHDQEHRVSSKQLSECDAELLCKQLFTEQRRPIHRLNRVHLGCVKLLEHVDNSDMNIVAPV